jgi:hypothetical protein
VYKPINKNKYNEEVKIEHFRDEDKFYIVESAQSAVFGYGQFVKLWILTQAGAKTKVEYIQQVTKVFMRNSDNYRSVIQNMGALKNVVDMESELMGPREMIPAVDAGSAY